MNTATGRACQLYFTDRPVVNIEGEKVNIEDVFTAKIASQIQKLREKLG